MRKKSNFIKWLLVGSCTMVVALSGFHTVNAENDFAENERAYMDKCSSNTLSRSEIAVCEEFNSYLKDKSANIQNNIDTLESDLTTVKEKINAVHDAIQSFNDQIASQQEEIDYILVNIKNKEDDIAYREGLLRERLYAMQTYSNSNQFLSFILGASDFSDLFSRIEGVNELTANDKQLIEQLNQDKKDLEEQRVWAEDAKATLEGLKAEQVAKENEYTDLVNQYAAKLDSQQQDKAEMDEYNAALDAALNESRISLEQQEWLNNGGASAGGGTEATGDAAAVVAWATSKIGLPYIWGGSGPAGYDCSGLTSQAYLQAAGIGIGRTTWDQIERGTSVGWGNFQPGDLIFFSTDGYCSHVGMYVGNGIMVHAPQPGSTVMYSNVNIAYWQNTFCGAKRYL